MASPNDLDRRGFLGSAGGGALAALLSSGGAARAGQDERGAFPPDPPRDLRPTGADVGSLYPDVRTLAGDAEFPCSFLSGRYDSLEAFKAEAREKVWESFGYRPRKVPLNPEVVDRSDLGDVVREKVMFSTSEHFRIPAYVHVPKNLKTPAPGIVDLHSHGGVFLFGKEKVIDFGRNHPMMTEYHRRNYGGRPTTTELARRGYVVVTTDAFYFGERRLLMDGDLEHGWDRSKYDLETAVLLNRRNRAKETTLCKTLALAGIAWPGIVTWDDMRTVDYLAARPEVDAARIGCVGVSLGGHRTYFLAGMDERIRAACVVGFMSTVRPMMKRHIDTHSWVHFVPGLHRWLDMPDVVSMMAPKPLMVQQCRQDGLFPPEGMEAAVRKIGAVYRRAGVEGRFAGRFYDVPHRFDVPMQDDAFDWFDRILKA